MGLGYRAQQRLLHQIVSAIGTPRESTRIAPKSWDLSLDKTIKFGHWFFLLTNPPVSGRCSKTYVRSVIGV
jgi:hypothetical protein